MIDYIEQWRAGNISDSEVLRLAGQDIVGIEEEFAPVLQQAKHAEKLRKEIQDHIRPAIDRVLGGKPSDVIGKVRFTRTNPQPKPFFDADKLMAFVDELASYGSGEVPISYVIQRITEAKEMKAASVAYKAEIVEKRKS